MTDKEEAAIRSDERARLRALAAARAKRLKTEGRTAQAAHWRHVARWMQAA